MYNKYGIGILIFSIVLGFSSVVEGQILVDKLANVKQNTSVKSTSERLLQTKISLSVKDQPLKTVLKKIQRESGVYVFYTRNTLQGIPNVSFKAENQSLEKLLHQLFKPYGIEYWATGSYIILLKKQRSPILETVSGQVTDAGSGEPLPGVNVVVKGTTTGTSTDSEGRYELNVPSLQDTLVFSFIGYQTREIPINGRTNINVALQTQAVSGEELVVVGYGTQRRQDLTGSVGSISQREISQNSVTSPDQILQGQVSGVQVVQNSGEPGAAPTVRIRGSNSIQGGNDPLYVIDGVPLSSTSGNPGVLGQGSTPSNPLANINPQDIASIDVLKDASATAIYGARGSNGVVIITTKEGESGAPQVNISSSYNLSRVGKSFDLLNATEYANLVNEANINAGAEPMFTEDEISSFGEGTDWQEEIFRVAPTKNAQLSISGGVNDTRYFISGGYLNQEGAVIGSNLDRGTFRVKLDQDISEKFRVGTNISFSTIDAGRLQDANNGGVSGTHASVVQDAFVANPILPVRENGQLFAGVNPVTGRDFANPVATAEEITNEETRNRFIANGYGEFDISNNLRLKTSLSLDNVNNEQKHFSPRNTLPGKFINGLGAVRFSKNTTWLVENTLNYSNTFSRMHNLGILFGVTFQGSESELVTQSSQDFPSDALGANSLQRGNFFRPPTTGTTESGLVSYIGRANYNIDNRYLITITGRMDGSSRFGENNKYGFFPSGAVAWRLSEESYIDLPEVVSDLKLRFSLGLTGNQSVPPYRSLATFRTINSFVGNQRLVGIAPGNIANPDLKWETTEQINVGLDTDLFNDRLSLTADLYKKTTRDLLLNVEIPTTTGFTTSLQNIGSVENKGLEISLNSRNFVGRFQWSTRFNITFNRNKVLDLGDQEEIIAPGGTPGFDQMNPAILREGEPFGSFFGLRFNGFQEDGQASYVDIDGDGSITGSDRTLIGNAQPDYTGGLTNNFAYGNFDLSLLLQWSVGNDVYNSNRRFLLDASGFTNHSREVLDLNNPLVPPKPNANNQLSRDSDFFIESGSFIRGKNIRLTYHVPVKNSRLGETIRNLSFYVGAQNFFTITNYSGLDPEVNDFGQNNLSRGIDNGTFPQTQQFLMGLNLGL